MRIILFLGLSGLKPRIKKMAEPEFRILTRTELEPHQFRLIEILWIDVSVRVDAKFLEEFPSLRIIVCSTTGETHMDKKELEKNKICFVNLRNHEKFLMSISSSAEHAWLLLMAANSSLMRSVEIAKSDDWNWAKIVKYELRNKSLGIIGFGRIGFKLSKFAESFGMKIVIFDKYKQIRQMDSYTVAESIEDLLRISDFVVISASVEPGDEPIIGANELALLDKSTVLVNIARGCLVDENAVIEGLQNESLGFYASDVLTFEEFGKDSKYYENLKFQLLQSDKALITPHVGGYSIDAREKCDLHLLDLLKTGSCECEL